MRPFLLLSLILLCVTARADYADHRNRKVDSLEQVLQSGQTLNDEQKILAYRDLMWGYLQIDGKRAEANAQQVLALSNERKWLNLRVDALRMLGMLAYGGDRFAEALSYYNWALAVTDTMRTDSRFSEKAIDDNLSSIYGAIGNLYNIQDKNLLAIEYYQKAMPIFEKYGWRESLTILHHNIAELYLSMGNDKEAERHYRQAIVKGEETGDSLMMVMSRRGLAKIYIDRDEYQQAKQTIDPAYAYYHAHSDEESSDYAEVLASLAKINLMNGHENLTQAKAFAREALDVVNDEMMTETRCEVYAAATMVEMKAKNWKAALQSRYISKVRTMMERFSTQNYQSSISQMEVLYETEKNQKVIEQLNREKQWHLWAGILLSALLLILALAFFLSWRGVRLQRRTALFKARFEGEVAERSRIARDLHDGLGGMLTMLRLKIEGDASKPELLKQLGDTATELRHVAHHLMPEQLLKNGLMTSLQDLAISVPGAHFSHFGNDERLSQDVELVLYRCAYELVNNAVKHAHANRIDIQLMQEESQVTLTVSDNGRGLDSESQQGGIGLQNIRERISHYHGTMHIVSGKEPRYGL